jgi:hypothetical protein
MSTLCPTLWILPPRRPAGQLSPRLTCRKGAIRSLSTQKMYRRPPSLPPLAFLSTRGCPLECGANLLTIQVGRAIRDCQAAFAPGWKTMSSAAGIMKRTYVTFVYRTGQQAPHQWQEVCDGHPRDGLTPPQDIGGRRRHAANPFPCGHHTGVPSPLSHQGAADISVDGQLLQETPPSIACTLRPLTDDLSGGRKELKQLEWSVAAAEQALLSATHLAHPYPHYSRSCFFSSHGHFGDSRGCVPLEVATWHDVLAAPCFLLQEAGGCAAEVLRHFRYMMDGSRFTVFMDQKPLTYALSRVSDPWTAHQCKQLSYVAEFTSDIIAAASMEADTLCRLPGHVSAGQPSSAVTCVKVPGGPRLPPCRESAKLISTFTS